MKKQIKKIIKYFKRLLNQFYKKIIISNNLKLDFLNNNIAENSIIYEVDLRSRKTGKSIKTIYSGYSYEKAYSIMREWYKNNLPLWNDENNIEDLIDDTDGVFADVYYIENEQKPHGVGDW